MSEVVNTEHGLLRVRPRWSPHLEVEGENVYYRGYFIGYVIPEEDGRFSVLVTGLSRRDTDQRYQTRHDALTFMAGVGKARYGEEDQ